VKVLVTGACGFVGGYVVHELLAHGHDLVLTDIQDSTANLALAGDGRVPDVPIVRADLRDLASVQRVVAGHGVEAAVHLAYVLNEPIARDPLLAVQVNCVGTANVLRAAHEGGLRRVVWMSTGGIFNAAAARGELLDDETAPAPANTYAHTKVLNEAVARQFFETHGLESVALRPAYVNGLGVPTSVMGASILVESAVKPALGLPGVVPFANDTVPFTDIEEIAVAVRLSLERDLPRGAHAYNPRASVTRMTEVMDHVRSLIPGAQLSPGTAARWGSKDPYAPAYGARMERDLGFQCRRTAFEQYARILDRIARNRTLVARLFDLEGVA
jgi:UDP-glucose 4-epimerase